MSNQAQKKPGVAWNHGKAAPLGEAAGVLDGHMGLGPSFHIPLAEGEGL